MSLLARAHDLQSLGQRRRRGLDSDRRALRRRRAPRPRRRSPAGLVRRGAAGERHRARRRRPRLGARDHLRAAPRSSTSWCRSFLSGEPIGVLLCLGTSATRSAVESVAKVLTLALERERLLRERAHVEALRESEELKTALLRAVSHDLSTPLTAIGFQVGALRRKLGGNVEALATVGELEVEASRLHRRIEDLLALGQLEAGSVVPRPEPVPPADLFRSARESLSLVRRSFNVTVDADCPEVFADPSLALEIVVNLVENADRASSDGAAIELCAGALQRQGAPRRARSRPRPRRPRAGMDDRRPRRHAARPRARDRAAVRRRQRRLGSSSQARTGGGVAAWVLLPAAAEGRPREPRPHRARGRRRSRDPARAVRRARRRRATTRSPAATAPRR